MSELVVYYSRKGSVEKLALDYVREHGCDFLTLEVAEDVYGAKGWLRCGAYAMREKSMTLFPYDTDVAAYDKVVLFTPVWAGRVSAPMLAFMRKEKHNIAEAEYVFVSASGEADAAALGRVCDRILRLDPQPARGVKSEGGGIAAIINRIKSKDDNNATEKTEKSD